jgi:hypothetical protein
MPMPGFLVGHATHPEWRAALALAAAQIDALGAAHERSAAGPLSLGFVYFTDHYAPHAQALFAELRQRWPGLQVAGFAPPLYRPGQPCEQAAQAQAMGLVNAVAPDMAAAQGIADGWLAALGACAPGAVADAKALIADVAGRPITDDLRRLTATRIAARRASAEGREGVAAFLGKTRPEWNR